MAHYPYRFFILKTFFLASIIAKGGQLGIILSLTGPLAPYGHTAKKGLDIALETLKKRQQPLSVQLEDDASNPQQAGLAMNRLNALGIPLVIGAMTSASTLIAASNGKSLSIPIISPGATSNHIFGLENPYVFPICFNNESQGKLLAQFASEELRSKRVVVFVDQGSDYGKEISISLKKQLKEFNIKVIKEYLYQSNTISFSPYLSSIRLSLKKNMPDRKPDLIIFIGYAHQAGHALKEAGEMGLGLTFLGSDGFDDPVLFKLSGNHGNNHYAITHFSSSENKLNVKEFAKEYKNRYFEEPGIWAPLLYDAVMLASEKLTSKKLTKDSKVIFQRLSEGGPFFGITGEIETRKGLPNRKSGVFVKSTFDKQNSQYHFEFFKRLILHSF